MSSREQKSFKDDCMDIVYILQKYDKNITLFEAASIIIDHSAYDNNKLDESIFSDEQILLGIFAENRLQINDPLHLIVIELAVNIQQLVPYIANVMADFSAKCMLTDSFIKMQHRIIEKFSLDSLPLKLIDLIVGNNIFKCLLLDGKIVYFDHEHHFDIRNVSISPDQRVEIIELTQQQFLERNE